MSGRTMEVLLQDIVVFTGTEEDARQYAYGVVLQIGVKHTRPYPASQAYVTAGALAILSGGVDDFAPETSKSPWTVRLIDAAAADSAASTIPALVAERSAA